MMTAKDRSSPWRFFIICCSKASIQTGVQCGVQHILFLSHQFRMTDENIKKTAYKIQIQPVIRTSVKFASVSVPFDLRRWFIALTSIRSSTSVWSKVLICGRCKRGNLADLSDWPFLMGNDENPGTNPTHICSSEWCGWYTLDPVSNCPWWWWSSSPPVITTSTFISKFIFCLWCGMTFLGVIVSCITSI
jgi:hypothetical protein